MDEERLLIERARSGERAAFERLIALHQDRLYRLCLSMLGDAQDAEDAAQESFLKAYRSLGKFRLDSSFSTWLHRIGSNACLDRLRGRARGKSQSLDEIVAQEGERLSRLLGPDEAAALESKDLAERLLETLPAEQRLVLTLRELQGLSYEEIAETTGASLDSVKARLRRAREALEEKLRHF